MPENRNNLGGLSFDGRGTVCMDTWRVLDCCRDRDCFEDARVYLTAMGEQIVAGASNVRTKNAELIWAYVGVSEVPFNNGFYQINVRYYILIELECCVGIGRSQTVRGICIAEKNVILFGGSGRAVTYCSKPGSTPCDLPEPESIMTNDPVAAVETVEPVVLATHVECECQPCSCQSELPELPRAVMASMDGPLSQSEGIPRVYVTVGIFSVVRIQRPAQLLVQATDYSVPEKECPPSAEEDPCSLFNTMAFPVSQFRGYGGQAPEYRGNNRPCGCGNKN